MIYTHHNAQRGIKVIDVESGEQLRYVVRVDTDAGCVAYLADPIQIGPDGEALMLEANYRSVYPLGADKLGRPCLIHCYGRIG